MRETAEIVKVKKNKAGAITDVMLDDGNVIPINHALLMAKDHQIEGMNVVRGKNGGEFLRSEQDGPVNDAINNLPQMKK